MQVVVLAGGQGRRLRPFTFSFPKPLMPIGDKPIIDIVFSQLRLAGAKEVILSTGYLAELLRAYCGDGSRWGFPLRYIHEQTPLNTAGALQLIPDLEENFLVMNGDILTTLDYGALWQHHSRSNSPATIAICKRNVQIDLGVVTTSSSNLLDSYTEKPCLTYYVSMGVNVLSRRCLAFIRPQESLSMPDLLLRVKSAGQSVQCWKSTAEWLDIGRPDDYQLAQERFEKSPDIYLRRE